MQIGLLKRGQSSKNFKFNTFVAVFGLVDLG